MMEKYIKPLFLITALAGLVGCSNITTGNQKYGVSGAVAGSTSANADSNLEHCSSPLGTLAIDDGRNADWFGQFGSATKITSIEPLLRIAVQQSNCFVITSIGNQKRILASQTSPTNNVIQVSIVPALNSRKGKG